MTSKETTPGSSKTLGERLLQWLFPHRRYLSRYRHYVLQRHRNFDVKGLATQGLYTLRLQHVFVDLSLGPQAPHWASADPVRPMPGSLPNGRRKFWDYLAHPHTKERNLVIIGPPGSGKTTLLKYVALSLAAADQENGQEIPQRLPILLFLRHHAQSIREDATFSLLQALQERLSPQVSIPTSWLETQLQKGRCLIMLDGLDEVGDGVTRRCVVDWVEQQMRRYAGNRFVVTSRPFGYLSNPFNNVTILEVRPFTIEQIEKFVHNWYLANEIMSTQRDDAGVRQSAKSAAQDLMWRLRQAPALLEMSVNPLLLTMIATIHRYRSSLPGRRVELYAEICDVFLGKRQEARGLSLDWSPAQKQRVLQPLAYAMMRQRRREIPAAEAAAVIGKTLAQVSPTTTAEVFLQMIENSSGLLVEREAGRYGFAHLTFQEYLAAVHILDQKLEPQLGQWVEDGWWQETIRLYAAQTDATKVIKACLTRKSPSVQALTLAMECLEEAQEVRPELRAVFGKLAKSVEHPSPTVRHLVAEVQLHLRLRRLARIDEQRYIDSSLITHAEYQLFLDEVREADHYHQPDHWLTYRFPEGQGREPVVGIRPLDAVAFCNWLTQRESGEWQYRLPTAAELEIDPTITDSQLEDFAYWIVAGRGYQTVPFKLADPSFLDNMGRQLKQRFADDWALQRSYASEGAIRRARALVVNRARRRFFLLYDLDRDIVLDPDIVSDFHRVRDRFTGARAYRLDSLLDEAINEIQSYGLNQEPTIDVDYIASVGRAFMRELFDANAPPAALDLARELIRDLNRARELASRRMVILNPDLIRHLAGALAHLRDLILFLNRAHVHARTRVRTRSLLLLVQTIDALEKQHSGGKIEIPAAEKKVLNSYLDLYVDFAILEERISGVLPPLEGIRIVRERRPPLAANHFSVGR